MILTYQVGNQTHRLHLDPGSGIALEHEDGVFLIAPGKHDELTITALDQAFSIVPIDAQRFRLYQGDFT